MKMAKYTQDYKTNADILSELKINSVVKKIQNYINKWTQRIRRMDRQTATLKLWNIKNVGIEAN